MTSSKKLTVENKVVLTIGWIILIVAICTWIKILTL